MINLNKSSYYSHKYNVKLIHNVLKYCKSILYILKKLTLSLRKNYIKIFIMHLKNIIYK